MSKASYPQKLPASIKAAAQRMAREDGASLNHGISAAVAQKVGAVETAAEIFKRRAEGASPSDLPPFRGIARSEPAPSDERILVTLSDGTFLLFEPGVF
jgi:hypothetical protein